MGFGTPSRAIRPSMTLTTPPTALPPYITVAGPRTTSIRSAANGEVATVWSGLIADTSVIPSPFWSSRTSNPPRPRMIGRLEFGPK